MSTTTPDAPERDTPQKDDRDERIRELEAQLRAAQGGPTSDPNSDKRPWSIAASNAEDEHKRDEAPLPYRGDGAVLHHFPHITGGSGGPTVGPYVRALVDLLAELGYATNDVIRGRSQHYDNTVAGDVARFRMDHDVREDVNAYHGHPDPAEDVAKHLVGPYTIQAIFDKVAEKRGQDVAGVIGQVEYDVLRHQQAQR